MRYKKYLPVILTAGLLLFWHYYGHSMLRQKIFAVRDDTAQSELKAGIKLLDNVAPQYVEFGKYNIEIKIRAEYALTARAVYIDIYDRFPHIGFKSESDRMKDVYNAVSPLDISVFTGATAADDNWRKIKVSHEYRVVLWRYEYADNPTVNYDEISNLHIIPATNAIRHGFETIRKGDIVTLKGYLIDWRETGEFADYPYKTALTAGEVADFKLGGRTSGLCFYVYVTELTTGGYKYT